MPGVQHVAVLVSELRTGHVDLRIVVDLAAERVGEVDAQLETVDVERVLQTSVQIRVGVALVDQVFAREHAVVVGVVVARASVGVGRADVGFRHRVFLAFLGALPRAAVFESPERVERVALDVAVHHVGVVARRVVGRNEVLGTDVVDLLFVVRQGERRRPVELRADDVVALDRQLDTLVRGRADVGPARRVTGLGRNGQRHQQVGRFGFVGFGRDVQAAFEHRPVDRHVVGRGLLPREVRGVQAAAVERHGLRSVEQIAARRRGEGGERTVGADRVVTRQTGAQAQRQVVDPVAVLQEILVRNVPLEGGRREERPLVVGREVRGSVVTSRHGQVIARLPVVVQTRVDRRFGFLRVGSARRIGLFVLHGVHVVPQDGVVHVAFAAQVEIVRGETVSRETAENVERMAVLFELVAGRGLPRERVLVPLGAVGLAAFVLALQGKGSRIVTVGMPLVEVVGEGAVDREVLHRLQFQREGVVVRVAFEVIGVQVDQRTLRVDLLSVVIQRVIRVVRLEQR